MPVCSENTIKILYAEKIVQIINTIERIFSECDNDMKQLGADNVDLENRDINQKDIAEQTDKLYKYANGKLQQYYDAMNEAITNI